MTSTEQHSPCECKNDLQLYKNSESEEPSLPPAKKVKRNISISNEKVYVPPIISSVAANLHVDTVFSYLMRLRIDDLTRKIKNPEYFCNESFSTLTKSLSRNSKRTRSVSPPPIYDSSGKRVNTRAVRYKNILMQKRHLLIQELIAKDSTFIPPPDYKPEKILVKMYIPIDKYPEYNFLGLILGPRGYTQKRMEKETSCKIAIRGRGAVRDNKVDNWASDDKLHVLITGEYQEDVDKATSLISKLLVPVSDAKNDHKTRQLVELSKLDGLIDNSNKDTLTTTTKCRICGNTGHRLFECPVRTGEAWAPANVFCEICCQTTHTTADCKLRGTPAAEELVQKNEKLTKEYQDFVNDLFETFDNDNNDEDSNIPPPPPPPQPN